MALSFLFAHKPEIFNFHGENELWAVALGGIYCDWTSKVLTDLLAYTQSKAMPSYVHLLTLALLSSEVGCEDFLQIIFTNPDAIVFYTYFDHAFATSLMV